MIAIYIATALVRRCRLRTFVMLSRDTEGPNKEQVYDRVSSFDRLSCFANRALSDVHAVVSLGQTSASSECQHGYDVLPPRSRGRFPLGCSDPPLVYRALGAHWRSLYRWSKLMWGSPTTASPV